MNIPIGTPAESPGELYLPTDVSPEEVFQAIGRLRKEARDEIDRLIRFLDDTDDHMEREDSGDDEPSLGFQDQSPGRGGDILSPSDDREADDSDDELSGDENEPSLGSGAVHEHSTQCSGLWANPGRGLADAEDEHDGREQDSEDEGAQCEDEGAGDVDREPSLGWTLDGVAGSQSGDDRELQDHASMRPKRDRKKPVRSIDVQSRGYGGYKVIKELSPRQSEAMSGKIDHDSGISVDGNTRGLR